MNRRNFVKVLGATFAVSMLPAVENQDEFIQAWKWPGNSYGFGGKLHPETVKNVDEFLKRVHYALVSRNVYPDRAVRFKVRQIPFAVKDVEYWA